MAPKYEICKPTTATPTQLQILGACILRIQRRVMLRLNGNFSDYKICKVWISTTVRVLEARPSLLVIVVEGHIILLDYDQIVKPQT